MVGMSVLELHILIASPIVRHINEKLIKCKQEKGKNNIFVYDRI